MKQPRKRLNHTYKTVFGVAILVLLLLLSGCAPAGPAEPAGEAEQPQAAEQPAAEEAKAEEEQPAAESEAQAEEEGVPPEAVGTFTYWGGLIFSEEANNMLVERIEQWGEERGVPVDVVMINQNETVQRVSAAVEAGTMPDALDMGVGLMLLLSQNGQLEPLDDVFEEVGAAHGGWIKSADDATGPDLYGGHRYGVPFGTSGNVLYRRVDVLEPAGFTEPPQTWEEMGEMALAAQNPPEHYGMGFALSNVGDGNLTSNILQSWGGRIADDEGKNCTLDSPETREFLTWITGLYEAGAFPPGATTWDGAGDNTAYQSGQALFIANPGSVYLNIRENDPELLEATRFSALPAGPVMRIVPQNPNVRVIPSAGQNKELAKDLLKYLADDEFMEAYYNVAIYGPVLNSQTEISVFSESPVHVGLLDLAINGTPPGVPDVNNAAFTEFQNTFPIPRMIQRVVVDGVSIDEAVQETQAACQAVYDKYE